MDLGSNPRETCWRTGLGTLLLVRPWYWPVAVCPALAAAMTGAISVSRLAAVGVCAAAMAAWAEAINAICDYETDSLHRSVCNDPSCASGSRVLVDAWLDQRIAKLVCGTCAVFALIAALSLPWPAIYIALIGLLLGAAYSIPGVRLRNRPYIAVAAEILGYGVCTMLLGFSAAGVWRSANSIVVATTATAMALIGTTANISDLHADFSSGRKTLASIFGSRILVHGTGLLALTVILFRQSFVIDVSPAALAMIVAAVIARSVLSECNVNPLAVHATSVSVECILPLLLIR